MEGYIEQKIYGFVTKTGNNSSGKTCGFGKFSKRKYRNYEKGMRK